MLYFKKALTTAFFCLLVFGISPLLKAQDKLKVQTLKNKLLSEKNDFERLNQLSQIIHEICQYDSVNTEKYISDAVSLAVKLKQQKKIGKFFAQKALMYQSFSNLNKALNTYAIALNYTKRYHLKLEEADVYNNIANIYDDLNLEKLVLEYQEKALQIYISENSEYDISVIYANQGTNKARKGDYKSGVELLIKALKIRERINNINGIASVSSNLSIIFKIMKRYDDAIYYNDIAIKNYSTLKEPVRLAQCFAVRSSIYRILGRFDEAIIYINKTIPIFEEFKDNNGLRNNYDNLGLIYLNQKNDKQQALNYYEKSKKISESLKSAQGIVSANINIAQVTFELGDLIKCKKAIDEAEILAKNNNLKEELSELQKIKLNYLIATSDINNAQKTFQKYIDLRDTLGNEGVNKQISEIKIAYETEKKQQQIALLDNKNKIQILELYKGKLELQNKSLENDKNIFKIGSQNLLIEKNLLDLAQKQIEAKAKSQQIVLLAAQNEVQKLELLKRNIYLAIIAFAMIFSILISYLFYNRYKLKQEARLQDEVIIQQDLSTKAILNAEENERRRISGELHDGLGQMFSAIKMNLSALTTSLNFKDEHSKFMFLKTMDLVDESCKEVRVISHQMAPNVLLKSGLAAAIRDFINKIDAQKLRINLETIGLQERLDRNIETVLYRVIQESVNNVIKHAEANSLDIQLAKDKEGINVMIEDNGKGFDINDIDKFDGVGLKNIQSRVDFLKGTVDFSSQVNKGTLVAIFIPLQNKK